jgi:cyanophycin synthetase
VDIFELIVNQSRQKPYAVAIITSNTAINFRLLEWMVINCMQTLEESAPLAATSMVGLCIKSQVTHLVVALALLRLGKAHIALPAGNPTLVNISLATQAGVGLIVSDHVSGGDMPIPRQVIDFDQLRKPPPEVAVGRTEPDPDAVALYVAGSGTTGEPKLIAYTGRALLASIGRDLRARPIAPGERHLSLTPVDYFTAKRRTLGCLAAGGSAFLGDVSTGWLGVCDLMAIDHLSLVVRHAEELLTAIKSTGGKARLPRLKTLAVGSAPVSEGLRARLISTLSRNSLITYGTNEFGEATIATPDIQSAYPGSVGRPCPGVEVSIVDDRGTPLPQGERGFVRLRGEGMFSGYVNDPAATSRVLRDGWYYPGDLGSLTPEGWLVFHGRADDLMIFDGINIYPREIELVLEQHPAVLEAAAFPINSPKHNDIPVAVVRQKEPFTGEPLFEFCKNRLGVKAPVQIFTVDEFPRNAAGKILKRTLRADIMLKLK